MKINWSKEVDKLRKYAEEGTILADIGKAYGVSRQRIYQVFDKYGIDTPERKRKNYLKGQPPKKYWLNKILCSKDITKTERQNILENLHIPERCPITNVKLNYDGTGVEGWSRQDNSPSLDQIIPGKGYTLNNVAIMSWRANRIKNDGSAAEHYRIAEYIEDFLDSIQ